MKPTLVVLAAGMGSRYGGVKQIDSVGLNGETLLDFASYDALQADFGKIVYIIRKDIEKDFRERFFDRVAKNANVDYVFQDKDTLFSDEEKKLITNRQKPWGTIHALLCAEKAVNENYAVINADDYYGKSAFVTLGKHLSTVDPSSDEHAMVGYVLGNTLSKSGTVSRGVCELKDSYLMGMRENIKIGYEGDGITGELDGEKKVYDGKEIVSMNFFGFTPKSFAYFNEYFDDFKKEYLTSEKIEVYLPEAAGKMVKEGRGTIKCYYSDEMWFGMTYPEDRQIVKDEIAKKIAEGYYPEKLWEKE